jgi:hypothetical protein
VSEQSTLFSIDAYTVQGEKGLCLDCSRDTLRSGDYYMLRDDVWREANPSVEGMLCLDCLEKRLGRGVGWWDLSPAPINVHFLTERWRRVVQRWSHW